MTDETDEGGNSNSQLQMRSWLINSVLKSETNYVDDLTVLLKVS